MIKLQKILFPTDFGESAEEALRYAASLAVEFQAELIVMHVVSLFGAERFGPEEGFSAMQKYAEDYAAELDRHAHQRMDRTLETHRRPDLAMRKLVVRGVSPYHEILDTAEREKVGLVVMGTYGRGGISHLLFGSTAEQVVRLCGCPVLTVRHHASRQMDLSRIKNILFTTDFSEYSKKALPYAVSFARRYRAALHVLHVFEQTIHPSFYILDKTTPFDLDDSLRDRALDALDEFVYEDLRRGIEFYCEIADGQPFEQILNYAHAHEIDLIVIATHGLTGLEHMLIGSNTERVVRKAPCPVLSVKSPEQEFVKPSPPAST